LNARSPDLFFEESGYPLPFRTTGCPAAAAAAALIARRTQKVLGMEAGIMDFLSFFSGIYHSYRHMSRKI
jgi:hypothetical protein